jgi:hypothetical protein
MPDQPPFWQDIRWLVTTFFALWGAGLSTYQQIVSYLQKKPNIRVLFQKGLVPGGTFSDLGEAEGLDEVVSITIKNYGHPEMTFEPLCCQLEVKGFTKGTIVIVPTATEPRLPATIRHGQNIKIVAPMTGFQKEVERLCPNPPYVVRLRVKDAIGRLFYSDWSLLKF